MNIVDINRRLQQIEAAFASLRSDDLSSASVSVEQRTTHVVTTVDFSGATTEPELRNALELVIANIACLKDHLKEWCKARGETFSGKNKFPGDELIDNNRSVALVHDLWNTQKHGYLEKPRSGTRPRFENVKKVMSLSAGTSAGASAEWSFDPWSGERKVDTSGGGSAVIEVVADVFDESACRIGDLSTICRDAIEAWEGLLISKGVQLPPRQTEG